MPSGKEIVDVVVGETRATADIKIWRKQRSSLEPSQRFQGDKAYVGEPLINTPHKKPRSLTPAQSRENKSKAQKRIFVEHLIRLLKVFRVAAERFRLKGIGNKLERSRFCQYPFVHKYNWIIMIIKQGVRVGESACGRLSHA